MKYGSIYPFRKYLVYKGVGLLCSIRIGGEEQNIILLLVSDKKNDIYMKSKFYEFELLGNLTRCWRLV